jgi:type VI secretion system protein ImpB
MVENSQKFVAFDGRKRAPRVQLEYEADFLGSEKVSLPFVIGVLADLSGKPQEGEDLVEVDRRKFVEIDCDNFDMRLKAIKPRAAFSVPNMVRGEGEMLVDMRFESIDDFLPAAVAHKISGLKELLETGAPFQSIDAARAAVDKKLAVRST